MQLRSLFTIILPGNLLISDLNNSTIKQSNVAYIDNREYITNATGIRHVDWSDSGNAFSFFDTSLKMHKNLFKRGAIEIRRIFNGNKFVLRYWRVSPTSIDSDEDLSFSLSINNKVVEQTSENTQNIKFYKDELEKNFDEYDSLKDTKYYVSRTTDGSAMLQVMTLTSDYLGLTFDDLENIVVTFPIKPIYSANGRDHDFWEVKLSKLHNRDKTINAIKNKAVIKIPEHYNFRFDEFGKTKEEVKYLNMNININPLSQDKKLVNLVQIKSESTKHNETGFYKKEWEGTPYLKEKYPNQDSFDGLKKVMDANTHFIKNQSFGTLLIDSIHNQSLSKNAIPVETETTSSIYNKGVDIKNIAINDYYEFDYKQGKLVNSVSGQNKGLFIPFNFKGNFNTSYRLIWKTNEKSKNSEHSIVINNSQKVIRPMLDPYSGLIKLKINDKSDERTQPYKFKFLSDQIKEIIELKENPTIEMFERFRNGQES
ncbi:hypothetical protein J7892_00170 [Mycoplasmopsis agalactiae]|nr:hypothetical protein [Mycoplasmopsis agalactiae]